MKQAFIYIGDYDKIKDVNYPITLSADNEDKQVTYIVCLPFNNKHTIDYLNSLSDKEKYLLASTDKSAYIFSSTKDFLLSLNTRYIDVNEFMFYEIKVVLSKL